MAQTGITTAIGMAGESAWREVPLTVITGTNYGVGIADSNPHRFLTVEPSGGLVPQPEVVVPDNEVDGDVEPTRNMLLSKVYGGSFSFKADGENLLMPLLAVLGRDVQTQVQTAGSVITTNMYQHLLSPYKFAPSMTFEEIFGDASMARLSSGCVVPRLSMSFGKEIMCNMDVVPYRQVPNNYPVANVKTDYAFGETPAIIPSQMSTAFGNGTNTWQRTATPTYIDVQQESAGVINANSVFVFADIANGLQAGYGSAFLKVNGTDYAVELLEGFTIDIARQISSSMIAGSGYDPGTTTGSQITVGGRMSIQFEDTTIQLAAMSAKKLSMNFQVIGLVPGTGGSQAYVLDVFIPNFRILSPEGPTIVDGPMLVGGTWKAKKDPTFGKSIFIKLINTYDIRRLGGCYPIPSTITAPTAVGTAVSTFSNASNIVPGDQHTYTNASVNGGVGVTRTVLSVNYSTNVVTYTVNVGFIFPATTATTVVRNRVGGLGGWTNLA